MTVASLCDRHAGVSRMKRRWQPADLNGEPSKRAQNGHRRHSAMQTTNAHVLRATDEAEVLM